MSRLPNPGSDVGLWGEILNDFLLREHTITGSLKIRADGTFEPTIAKGETSQYLRGDKQWQTLDKTAVGLSNVDNTADADKPISAATQTAIDGKLDKNSGTFSSDITVKSKSLSTRDNGTNVAVGVGTATPASVVTSRAVVDIEDTTGNGAELRLNSLAAEGRFYNSNTQFGFGTDTAHAMGFYTNGGGNTRIYIGSTGLIGFGTVTPTHSLTIPSSATGVAHYNTSDMTTNYERARTYWSGNSFNISVEKGGTGLPRGLSILGSPVAIGTASTTFGIAEGTSSSGYYQFNRSSGTANATISAVTGTWSQSSGSCVGLSISPTINQSSTAGYTALKVDATETATGSGAKTLLDLQIGSSSKFRVDNSGSATMTSTAAYNTADQTTNYERVRQYWDSNILNIVTERGGSGTLRPMRIGSGPNVGINMNDSGGGAANTGKIALSVAATGTAFPITNSVNVSSSSSQQTIFSISAAINQSSTAGYTALLVNATETTTGSGTKNLIDAQVGGATKFKVDNAGSATMTGTSKAIATKATSYTATAVDYTILGDAASGSIVITLPAAANNAGRIYNIKKIDASANTVTIDGNGAETIDGAATQAISTQYNCVTIQCDGVRWWTL